MIKYRNIEDDIFKWLCTGCGRGSSASPPFTAHIKHRLKVLRSNIARNDPWDPLTGTLKIHHNGVQILVFLAGLGLDHSWAFVAF